MANFKLNQTGEQIQADLNLLDSNSATQGQVLTANGTGGASWQNASGGGTEVVANPVLAGTESDLTGLEVAGTKYKIPSGGGTQLYVHNIRIKGTYKIKNNSIEFSMETALIRIISSKPDSYTINDYAALANIIGNTTSYYDSAHMGESCGMVVSGQGNHFRKIYAMFGTLRITLSVSAFDTSFNFLSIDTINLTELTDAVVPL